jgi:RHS repeat-associated protein
LVCATVPAGPGAVTETTTAYNQFLQPTQTIETGGGDATRTSVTNYLPDGRVDTKKTTVTGLPDSKPVPMSKNLYDAATGINIGTASLSDTGTEAAKTISIIDNWGRTTSYTNAGNETTTTTYTPTGQVASTATPYGTTTYTYDGPDANGKEERRGLPVAMTVTDHGIAGTSGTYKAAYDGAGSLTTQTMPGGLSQTRSYDQAGRTEGLAYHGHTTRTADDGTTTSGDGQWVAWSQVRNTLGQVVAESTPDGALFTEGTGGQLGSAYHREFMYDRSGFLTEVKDRTAPIGATLNSDPAEGIVTGCTTRSYTFDGNGNRTRLSTAGPAADGACTTTNPQLKNWSYDSADRILHGANNLGQYAYDGLGRQLEIPAADVPGAGTSIPAANIAIGYYDTEEARHITRNGQTTTFGLDPSGRRMTITNGNNVDTNGYSDTSDNPDWVSRNTGETITRVRYEATIGKDLGVTIGEDTAKLVIINPHGDAVATLVMPAEGHATGIETWANYDEYGNQTVTAPGTGINTYAWHGGAQRALDNSGLILMGARLYNSSTGLFTSRDPVVGGNTTAYAYPQDPVNLHDVSGRALPVLLVLGWLARLGIKWIIQWIGKTAIKKAAKSYVLSKNQNFWIHTMNPKHYWGSVGARSREQVAELIGRAMSEGQHVAHQRGSMKAVWRYKGRIIEVTYSQEGGQISNAWVRR